MERTDTTGQPRTNREGVLASRDANLQVRLWIGRNPGLFVGLCLAAGFLLGKGPARGGKS
jgi:hypothetical protein